MQDRKTLPAEEIKALAGNFQAVSSWVTVTQEMIDTFARATDDHQFIHVNPARAAAETQFGGTIAHGFLTLSLLSTMAYEALPPLIGTELSVNQGFENVRFQAPVKTGSRIRAHFNIARVHARPSGWVEIGYDVSMEIEDQKRPALTLHWLTLTRVEKERAKA